MATPYSTVFSSFLNKIEDTMFSQLTQTDAEIVMIELLNSAIVSFDFPKINIFDKNDTTKQFNQTLTIHEIEIISNLMKLSWVDSKVNSIYLIRQAMSEKDFKLTSQANHLNSLLKLQESTEKRVTRMINKYSYKSDNLPDYSGLVGDDS